MVGLIRSGLVSACHGQRRNRRSVQTKKVTTLPHARPQDLVVLLHSPASKLVHETLTTASFSSGTVKPVRLPVLRPLSHVFDRVPSPFGCLGGNVFRVEMVYLDVLADKGKGMAEEEVVGRQLIFVWSRGQEIGQPGEEGQGCEDRLFIHH